MRSGLIGKKIGTSSHFNDIGVMTPITLIQIQECIVSDVKTIKKDGYNAIQLASIEINKKLAKVNKPQKKIFSSIDSKPKKILKEFRVLEDNLLEKGSIINATHFEKGQKIDVVGTSTGKGFAGAMKRHNFAGLRASHGVSISHRSHGSTGNSQDPGRVFKGKKMAGHLGAKQVTVHNLKIVDIDEDNQIILIKGSVPGKKNSIVYLKDAVKNSNKKI